MNILELVTKFTGGLRIGTIAGGLHLLNATPGRIEKTAAALRRFAPEEIAACHCAGFAAVSRLVTKFPGLCTEGHAGRVFDLS